MTFHEVPPYSHTGTFTGDQYHWGPYLYPHNPRRHSPFPIVSSTIPIHLDLHISPCPGGEHKVSFFRPMISNCTTVPDPATAPSVSSNGTRRHKVEHPLATRDTSRAIQIGTDRQRQLWHERKIDQTIGITKSRTPTKKSRDNQVLPTEKQKEKERKRKTTRPAYRFHFASPSPIIYHLLIDHQHHLPSYTA